MLAPLFPERTWSATCSTHPGHSGKWPGVKQGEEMLRPALLAWLEVSLLHWLKVTPAGS